MGGWVVQRAVARRPVLLALAALVFVTSLVLAGVTGYAEVAETKAVRDYFGSPGDSDSSLVLSARPTEDTAGQAERAAAVLTDLYADFHVQIARSVEGEGESTFVRWTLTPDPERLVPGELRALGKALGAGRDALAEAPGVAPRGVVASGDLAGTLEKVARSLDAAAAVRPVPPLLVAAVSLLMLVQLSRLLTFDRRSETALVRSRGASAGQLTRIAALEAAAVSVPAAGAGVVVPHLLLRAEGGGVPFVGWLLAGLVAVTTMAMVVTPAFLDARLPADRQNIDDSGRGRALNVGGAVLLVVAAAALSTWRFNQVGSGVYVDDAGVVRVDPLAVLAPAMLLLAAGVLATLIFGSAAHVVERTVARRRGLGGSLAARQVARRTVAFGGALLMVVIAVGAATIAASYTRTQSDAQDRVDAMRNGAVVRVDLPGGDPALRGPYAVPAAALSGLASVEAVMPVASVALEVGDLPGRLTGVDTARLAEVAPDTVEDSLASLRKVGSPSDEGWPVAEGATRLTVELEASGVWQGTGRDVTGLDLSMTLWVRDPAGVLVGVDAGVVTLPMTEEETGSRVALPVSAPAPDLVAGSRIVAVDIAVPALPRAAQLTFDAGSDTSGWVAVSGVDAFVVEEDGAATGLLHPGMTDVLRLTPGGGPLPVVVDRFLSQRLDLSVGDSLTLELGNGRSLEGNVHAIADKLPGEAGTARIFTEAALLAGATLRETVAVPGVTQLWVAPRSDAAVADILEALPAAEVRSADARSIDALLVPAGRTLWFGAAGALLLAVLGVGSVVVREGHARRGEIVVLRSVGLTAREQARGRRRELLPVLGAGWLLGVVGGLIVVVATVPGLARSALVDAAGDPVSLSFDATPWILLVGVHVAAVIAVVLLHAEGLRREVLLAIPSEVER